MTALEALDKLDEVLCDIEIKHKENLGYTKPLTKSIEKELKALEIIKKKNVNVGLVKVLGSVEQYNQTYVYDNMLNVKWCLTEEEFNILKEGLEYE